MGDDFFDDGSNDFGRLSFRKGKCLRTSIFSLEVNVEAAIIPEWV